MAGYTKLNLLEVENLAATRGLPGDMQARFPGGELESSQLSISHQVYGPNFRQPFGHSHKTQEEVYVVVAGGGKMALDDEVIDVAQWDAIRVAPEVMRAFEGGPEGIEIIAIGASPGSEEVRVDGNDPQPGWWAE